MRLADGRIVKQSSLREAVLPYLRQAILAGELAPGTRLSESDIARRLGVSRSPVREAIAHLEQEGLVVRHPNRGAFVTEVLTSRAISELAGLRNLLETFAIRLLGKRVAEDDVRDLHAITHDMDAAARRRDWDAIAAIDYRFHRGLIALADHHKLLHAWTGVADQYWALYLPRVQRLGRDIDNWGRNHRRILDALTGGRPDVAAMYVEFNILHSAEELNEVMAGRQEDPADGVVTL